MKKILLALAVSTILFSCKKEKDIPALSDNCGVIIDGPGMRLDDSTHFFIIQFNDATTERITLTQEQWNKKAYHNGDVYCK